MPTAPPRDPQLLKGVLPMLVLAVLRQRDSYGYDLVVRLQETGLTDISAGSVYPVLARLEREGHLNRQIEGLPTSQEVRRRAERGEGLTVPELSVISMLFWAQIEKVASSVEASVTPVTVDWVS